MDSVSGKPSPCFSSLSDLSLPSCADTTVVHVFSLRPTWYEVGYWHPETACWVSDEPSVLAYLTAQGYIFVRLFLVVPLTPHTGLRYWSSFSSLWIQADSTLAYPLFPSGLVHPSRPVDWAHQGKYGYFTDAGLFIDLDLEVNALLGSCGYYNPKYHF
jgi:hypothetical protein